ncbi:MAG TPA: GGDEF domain-containing protein [Solirubrobacteraceae bacterium]|jgi:diguanylate cyclase (GGDEF)-like protein
MADTRRNGAPERGSESPAARLAAQATSRLDLNDAARNGRVRRRPPNGLAAGADRDALAAARDDVARLRDQAAERRDRELAARGGAAEGLALAAADRERAAADREAAARDRLEAQADREALMRRVVLAETDALTGARTRRAGLADLEHEIDRARRTSTPLTVAYLDVVGLKAVNDTHGHAAGDAMLQQVVHAVRAQLRSYDTIVRVGGDEFVCVLSGATPADAAQRFATVRAGLAAAPAPCEVKIGLAALRPGETSRELIARADAELPTQRDR